MKPIIIASLIVLAGLAGPASASCSSNPSKLTQTQINTILGGNFACGQKLSPPDSPGWNEQHLGSTSGSLVEQHEGGSTVETVGSWSTSTSGSNGRVTYSYTGGLTNVFEIAVVADINCNANVACTTLPQTYQFCGVAGGAPAVLSIRVTTASISPPISNCPSNP